MFQTISMWQLENMLNEQSMGHDGPYFLLDVRDPEEYKKSHLKGAVNIPYEELAFLADYGETVNNIPMGKKVVVYCSFGSHSMLAARILDRLGYEVINTSGGLAYYRGRNLVR